MQFCEDINIGRATVKAHADGGWALPGGARTTNHRVAIGTAERINATLGAQAFAEENRQAVMALRTRTRRAGMRPLAPI